MPLELPINRVHDRLVEWGCEQGAGDFTATFDQRCPWGIPGPIYVGDDDACGTGPEAAPNNVLMVHGDDERFTGPEAPYGEFLFRQPNSDYELRQILLAARTNVMCAYAFDGDRHWTPASVDKWWKEMSPRVLRVQDLAEQTNAARRKWARDGGYKDPNARPTPPPSAGLRRWLDFMTTDAERYLEAYTAIPD